LETSTLDTPVLTQDEKRLIRDITDSLKDSRNPHAAHLDQAICESIARLSDLARVMNAYPSLLESQSLGQQRRDTASLIEALSNATLFTVDMLLPMRAAVGQVYVMARLNLFRLLHQVAQEALGGRDDFTAVEDAIGGRISQSIHNKVIESLLIAIVCDDSLGRAVRTKAATALTHLWEDRFSRRIEAFLPVLETTWEARRQTTVQLGTLMGVSEIFALMRAGGDIRFLDYFSRKTCPPEELQAFREFLFSVSTEELESLNDRLLKGQEKPEAGVRVGTTLSLPPTYLYNHTATDFVTQLYLFFVKRHLEAHARRIRNLPGPKRTAEEYVMVYFLEQSCAMDGGQDGGQPGGSPLRDNRVGDSRAGDDRADATQPGGREDAAK